MSTDWNDGDPPVPGVYRASIEKNDAARRHFNGKAWSAPFYVGDPIGHMHRACEPKRRVRPEGIRWAGGPIEQDGSQVK